MTSPPDDVQHFDFPGGTGRHLGGARRPARTGAPHAHRGLTSAPGIVAEMQAQAQREDLVAAAPSVRAGRPGDDFGGTRSCWLVPDTVAADAGDTVFIDAGDTVVAEDDSRFEDCRTPPGAGSGA